MTWDTPLLAQIDGKVLTEPILLYTLHNKNLSDHALLDYYYRRLSLLIRGCLRMGSLEH